MASVNLTGLQPTNPVKPVHGTRYIITRSKAKQLISILEKEFPMESRKIVRDIKYEVANGNHDTHISFIIDDNDSDGQCVFPYACVALVVNLHEPY